MTTETQPITITNLTKSKANIVLDASKIDLFETCPKRYDIRHNRNKGLPIIHKAKALDLGSIVHSGMEVYYKALQQGIPYKDRLDGALMKIREISSNPNESNSDPEEVNHLLSVVEASLDYWRAEDENCLEVLNIEEPFAYILYEDEYVRIIITGKIDLLVNFHGIGRNASYDNLVIDHKSFSRNGPVYRKTNQFINYANAAGTNYLVVNRIGLPKSLKPEEKFKRLPLSYDPIYIQSWKDNLTKMISNEYLNCVADNYWPEKPTSCNKFNRLCEYYEVCDSSGEEEKERKINDNFIDIDPWDVTAKIGED